jgi:hypothetical protein
MHGREAEDTSMINRYRNLISAAEHDMDRL